MSATLEPAADDAPRLFEVPADKLVQNWQAAYARAVAYLEALGVPASERGPLAGEAIERALRSAAWSADSHAVAETLRALRALLPERYPSATVQQRTTLDEFTAWRLGAALSGRLGGEVPGVPPSSVGVRAGAFGSMPKLTRRPMTPEAIERGVLRGFFNRLRGKRPASVERRKRLRRWRRGLPWIHSARWRRVVLAELVLIPSVIASGFMVNVLPHQASTWLEFAVVVFFGALFGWISIGFWTALLGFFTLVGRRSRFAITNLELQAPGEFHPEGRTAIVMPICEEPVDRVFAGLKATYGSLEQTGTLSHFDFFILSDSSDPSTWVKEEEAWADWCHAVNGFGRIFYRRRRERERL